MWTVGSLEARPFPDTILGAGPPSFTDKRIPGKVWLLRVTPSLKTWVVAVPGRALLPAPGVH